MRLSQSSRGCQIPALEATETDRQGALEQSRANTGSLVGGSACSCHEIGRRDAHGAKPAPRHRLSAEGGAQEVQHAWMQLVEKGPRYRQDGPRWVEAVSAASHHQFLG